jgi:hypothetical protein
VPGTEKKKWTRKVDRKGLATGIVADATGIAIVLLQDCKRRKTKEEITDRRKEVAFKNQRFKEK